MKSLPALSTGIDHHAVGVPQAPSKHSLEALHCVVYNYTAVQPCSRAPRRGSERCGVERAGSAVRRRQQIERATQSCCTTAYVVRESKAALAILLVYTQRELAVRYDTLLRQPPPAARGAAAHERARRILLSTLQRGRGP